MGSNINRCKKLKGNRCEHQTGSKTSACRNAKQEHTSVRDCQSGTHIYGSQHPVHMPRVVSEGVSRVPGSRTICDPVQKHDIPPGPPLNGLREQECTLGKRDEPRSSC